MIESPPLIIHWCSDAGISRDLARFFAANVTTAYISHSELQGPRALDADQWRPDIVDIFAQEIETRIAREGGKISDRATSYPVMEARRGEHLVGIALVSLFLEAPVPYAILEDIAVETALRGQGIGKAIIDWVALEASKHGCERIFLESGKNNHRAHELFEREGFSATSVVMMKPLPKP